MKHARSAQVFIIARRHPELFDYLSERFADDPNVMVVLDRRFASRRRRALPAAAERRRVDRRSRPEVDEQLRATSLAIVTAPTVGAAADPVSEARQWVEAMQRGVKAVRGALDEHERLRHEARPIKQENERLRAEIDRSWKELVELDSRLSRAIELVTDLRSRLNKEPGGDPSP
jgi:hypothetical protein